MSNMFHSAPAIFVIMFFLVSIAGIAIFAYVISIFIRSANHNRQVSKMPEQTARTRVVAKRTAVWGDHAHTIYYATFEFDSHNRVELQMAGEEYGMLAEGDEGTLTYQGDRYVKFDRSY